MKLTILGCYAATPRTFSNSTSQVLEIKNHLFLVDCAEGTQVALRQNKIKFGKIEHIFISHLHGDHFYGLIGLISTFTLLNRQSDLHVYGPKGIKEIILLQLRLGGSYTGFNLYFHELTSKESEVLFEDDSVIVKTIPLEHRIYTNGFLFQEKVGLKKINIEAAEAHCIDKVYYRNIMLGKDVPSEDGRMIPNSVVALDPIPPKSYAFCSDSVYTESYLPIIENATVLYNEATFLESEAELATKTMHCTAKQAARIAKAAKVQHLILGHYSTRYGSIQPFQEEALELFPSVYLADDGRIFEFDKL